MITVDWRAVTGGRRKWGRFDDRAGVEEVLQKSLHDTHTKGYIPHRKPSTVYGQSHWCYTRLKKLYNLLYMHIQKYTSNLPAFSYHCMLLPWKHNNLLYLNRTKQRSVKIKSGSYKISLNDLKIISENHEKM